MFPGFPCSGPSGSDLDPLSSLMVEVVGDGSGGGGNGNGGSGGGGGVGSDVG